MKLSVKSLPKIWPIANILNIIFFDEDNHNEKKSLLEKHSFITETINRELMVIFFVLFSMIIYQCTYPLNCDLSNNYLCLCKYIIMVILRDLFITFIFYGGFHWLLYENKICKSKMNSVKFNKLYPDQEQWNRDRFYTLIGCIISSLYEICIFLLVDKNKYFYSSFFMYPFYSISWVYLIGAVRAIHFYFSHRMIHPWNRFKIFNKFDIGKYLYKNIHYMHHESRNIGPWSGLSMHPIEHILYFSSILIPIIFGIKQHFFHILCHKFSNLFVPIISHDGFDAPGAGSYFHYLHHAGSYFGCNYGTTHWLFNFDKLFGTYKDGTKYCKEKK